MVLFHDDSSVFRLKLRAIKSDQESYFEEIVKRILWNSLKKIRNRGARTEIKELVYGELHGDRPVSLTCTVRPSIHARRAAYGRSWETVGTLETPFAETRLLCNESVVRAAGEKMLLRGGGATTPRRASLTRRPSPARPPARRYPVGQPRSHSTPTDRVRRLRPADTTAHHGRRPTLYAPRERTVSPGGDDGEEGRHPFVYVYAYKAV